VPVSASTTDELLVENKGRVVVITLNRPERMNAISKDMLDQLSAKVTEANKDPDVRCIVLTGNGRGFCAGLDLVDVAGGGIGSGGSGSGSNRPKQLFDLRDAPVNVMWNIDTPMVCALNGAAAGYGMDLALLCDMRVAAESAKMAAVTAKRNVVPESGGTWLLPRLIGWAKAA
jgi:enoyl-CoA hydratase/carnithine racemase